LATSALADPPGRVGRVATLDGDVSFQPPGADDWSWASRNYPVTDGESFWTGDDGRVELQVGGVDVRADSQTEVDVPTLRYGEMRLALPQGSLDVRIWRAPEGGVVVTTPAGDVRFDRAGLFRVDVGAPTDDGSYPLVEVTTLEGDAGAPSPEGLVDVSAGQAAVLYAGYDPQIQDAQYAAIDDWGHELEARERPGYDSDSADETPTGYDDLAGSGDFAQDPQYGQVWFPRDVPADWAPYRYGHWSYVEPWGYTWIDDQPWGFAPFHYGRWAQVEGRWGWIPGQRTARPVYAPALVAFVGGVSWNFGGGGAIGWVPLGPQEVYRPTYRVSDSYLRQVNVNNVRNTTIINNLTVNNTTVNTVPVTSYRNALAATVVRASTFSGAAPVQRGALPVTPAALAQAPALAAAGRPAPSAQARSGAPVAFAGRPAPTTIAARPPARIAAVRAAVIAPPTAPNRPPVIVGARIAPPAPRPEQAAARPVLVAPAQVRNPAAQRAAAASAPRSLPTPPARTPQPSASMAPPRPPYAAPLRPPAPPARTTAPEDARADVQARQAQDAAQAQAQARQAQAARAQAAQAQAAEARDAEARQAQAQARDAQAARAQAAQAEAAQARARDAQAREADVRAPQPPRPEIRAPQPPPPRAAPPPEPRAKPSPPASNSDDKRRKDDAASPPRR
jgi:hypothetical protein